MRVSTLQPCFRLLEVRPSLRRSCAQLWPRWATTGNNIILLLTQLSASCWCPWVPFSRQSHFPFWPHAVQQLNSCRCTSSRSSWWGCAHAELGSYTDSTINLTLFQLSERSLPSLMDAFRRPPKRDARKADPKSLQNPVVPGSCSSWNLRRSHQVRPPLIGLKQKVQSMASSVFSNRIYTFCM